MSDIGYVYVLANSSMPNLVKVGKTTRNPFERAEELSRATGLPTPFIVVYEQLFHECSAAELFVHTYLEELGYRIADNREFFNAPAKVVVKAITLAPHPIEEVTEELPPEQDQNFEIDALSNIGYDEQLQAYPWANIFNEAVNHYKGDNGYLQDYSDAIRLFRQASRLGCAPANNYLGDMHLLGNGTSTDEQKALDMYKEGVRKGSIYSYWKMAWFYINYTQNIENSKKCLELFAKNRPTKIPHPNAFTSEEWFNFFYEISHLINNSICDELLPEFDMAAYCYADTIIDHYCIFLHHIKEIGGKLEMESNRTINYIESLLENATP